MRGVTAFIKLVPTTGNRDIFGKLTTRIAGSMLTVVADPEEFIGCRVG